MSNRLMSTVIAIIVVLMIIYSSLFTVKQGNEAVILRLGELNTNADNTIRVYDPGLHFKIPFVETVQTYDMRLRTLTADSSRVVTSEQKDVLIDAYMEWEIDDISLFYRSTNGNVFNAENLLKQYLESSLRAEVGNNTIQALINDSRDEMMMSLNQRVKEQAEQIGVNVVDVRVKQIDLPETVTESIYNRMRSDRQRVAASIRADGEQLAERIRANADAEVTITMAKASRDSREMKATADAKAGEIYTTTYAQSPVFYNFLRSMQAYETSFKNAKGDVFILQPNGKFFEAMAIQPAQTAPTAQ